MTEVPCGTLAKVTYKATCSRHLPEQYFTMAKHVTNDFCFVDAMEAAILKILQARRWFLIFYDTEKHLLGNGVSN